MGEQDRGGSRSRCDHCGDALDVETWHPAELVEEEGDDTRLVEFCSEECHERWQRDAEDRLSPGGSTTF